MCITSATSTFGGSGCGRAALWQAEKTNGGIIHAILVFIPSAVCIARAAKIPPSTGPNRELCRIVVQRLSGIHGLGCRRRSGHAEPDPGTVHPRWTLVE